jgi:cysteine desulfurase
MQKYIYLDYNSTTPTDERVLETMMPYLKDEFANATSSHKFGLSINEVIKNARQQVAKLINAEEKEIIFTSGATESINLALKGLAMANMNQGNHIITLQTEHKAVLDTCSYLETIGFDVEYLPTKLDGLVDLDILKQAIRKDTILVSIMFANNETGVIQPIEQVIQIVKQSNAKFFSDATQAVGKIPIDISSLSIDLMAFSGHKMYATKGVGGLYIRSGIKIEPQQHGGGHENSFRSGTLNVSGIIGLGKASEIAQEEMHENALSIRKLRDYLEEELITLGITEINGSPENRLFNTLNIQFKGIDSDIMIKALDDICVSSGSACTSMIPEPSHVLLAMGFSKKKASQSVRFSLGKYNNESDIEYTLNKIKDYLKSLQLISQN